jgi:hypothetical protein
MLAHRIETTIDQDQSILLENLPCLTLALKTEIAVLTNIRKVPSYR